MRCRRCGGEIYDLDMCDCPTLILVTEGEGDVRFFQHKDHGPHRFGSVAYPDGTTDRVILVHGDPTWFTASWEWASVPGDPTAMVVMPAGRAPRHVVTGISLEGCGADTEGSGDGER